MQNGIRKNNVYHWNIIIDALTSYKLSISLMLKLVMVLLTASYSLSSGVACEFYLDDPNLNPKL